MITILKMAADKIGKISMFSDFNENWYLGLLAANKIGKLLMVSEFQDLSPPLEMGIHLPVKFSKDRIISLWEFGRTSSRREEEEE
jgi:hypothetical protein